MDLGATDKVTTVSSVSSRTLVPCGFMRGDAKDGISCIVSEHTVFVHAILFTRDVWRTEILGSLLRPTLGVCMSSWLGRHRFRMQGHWPVRVRPCVHVATPRVLVFLKVDDVEPRISPFAEGGQGPTARHPTSVVHAYPPTGPRTSVPFPPFPRTVSFPSPVHQDTCGTSCRSVLSFVGSSRHGEGGGWRDLG